MFRRAFLPFLVACLPFVVNAQPTDTTRSTLVYVVRHAEKLDPADPDSPLSPEGQARAEDLVCKLSSCGVDRIYATTLRRTQETVAPLAARVGGTVITLPPDATTELVRRIQADPGHVVVVAGHSNTVPGIVKALSGVAVDGIPEHRFDRLYMIELPTTGPPRLQQLTYGKPTP
jgi:phosphohistidine phosphatase SixA